MKKTLFLFAAVLLALWVPSIYAQTPIGMWRTIDDETGHEKSIVKIYEYNGALVGRVEKLTDPKAKRNCDDCKGDKKGKPITGMTVVWGMKKDGGKAEWGSGNILDPKNGKVYTCRMWMEGKNLKVRGYIGPFFRTQTWYPAN